MENKYNMPQEDNILMAKRLLVDAVYKSANLEGIAVTFADTNDILNDVNVTSIKPSEISKVCNLRDAWKYIIEHINEELTLGFIEEIHTIVAKSELPYNKLGVFRNTGVLISGTNWRPEIPDMDTVYKEFNNVKSISNTTERALTMMLWIMRSQLFQDGNKRVASMICNKILIQDGKGIMTIPVELDGKFKEMLVQYYETNDMSELKKWVYDNCLDGV